MDGHYEKTVLEEGGGLYHPKELSTVVVDVVARYNTPDGSEGVFDQRDGVSLKIGRETTRYYSKVDFVSHTPLSGSSTWAGIPLKSNTCCI